MRDLFSEQGLLAKKLKQFQPRIQQQEMAEAVAQAIDDKSCLVVEAATGTGKTFAYLAPALLSGKKLLIATASKTLQDQLVYQDLPKIIAALGIARTVQNLKGRDNYLCRYRIHQIATETSDILNPYLPEITKIYHHLPKLSSGEKTELEFIPQDAPIWQGITATSDHCLAQKCPMLAECYLYKTRQKAMVADVVVVNHHLFFADTRLKNEGFGALLPVFEVFVFDEAHQLPEIATHFYSHMFSSAQIQKLLDEIQLLSAAQVDIQKIILDLDRQVEQAMAYLSKGDDIQSLQNLRDKTFFQLDDWHHALTTLRQFLAALPVDAELRIVKILERLDILLSDIGRCIQKDSRGVAWVKFLKRHFRVQWSPFEVSAQLQKLLNGLSATIVLTSATLRIGHGFDWFIQSMGIEQAKCLNLSSPYDWQKQALFYVPHGLPDPKDLSFYSKMLEVVVPIINRLGGRSFLLFTSHKALQDVSAALQKRLAFPVYIQGQMEKRLLLDEFRRQGNAVLCATGSFWEGVDVRGQALSCVIIDKLPFANVSEPWMKGKLQALEAQGFSSFEDYLLPQAIISLKQGVGRLIRTETDRGLLVMMDPRVIGRSYGLEIKQSLPQMPWTRNEARVMQFITDLELS